jgi:hypothetical protein
MNCALTPGSAAVRATPPISSKQIRIIGYIRSSGGGGAGFSSILGWGAL